MATLRRRRFQPADVSWRTYPSNIKSERTGIARAKWNKKQVTEVARIDVHCCHGAITRHRDYKVPTMWANRIGTGIRVPELWHTSACLRKNGVGGDSSTSQRPVCWDCRGCTYRSNIGQTACRCR